MSEKSYIPYGSGWSTPFAKWQGSLSALHPLELAVEALELTLQLLHLLLVGHAVAVLHELLEGRLVTVP